MLRLTGVLVVALVAVLVGLVTSGQAASTPQFTVVDLGTFGGSFSNAIDINNQGQIVGSSSTTTESRAFLWTPAAGMIDLGPGEARRINDSGQVVGNSCCWSGFTWTANGGRVSLGYWAADLNAAGQVVGDTIAGWGYRRAFSWTSAGGLIDIGALPGGDWSEAAAVNDSGAVVGFSGHAFMWTMSGGMIDLGSLGGGSTAEAINATGQVVGRAMVNGLNHAFSWTAVGGMVDLGTLSESPTPAVAIESEAVAVNDAGRVVGWSDVYGEWRHAFTWTQSDGMIDLGVGVARAVNARGQVVGNDNDGAFVWTAAGGKIDLPTLPGGSGGDALAINNKGEIVGYSTTASGQIHATLWVPADTTPPVLAVADLTVDATGPAGAQVTFTVTATDDTDPSPIVTCTPSSGSAFAIGETTVNCQAVDEAGNIATANFTVTVKGAAAQFADLRGAVQGVGPGTSLADKVEAAQAAYTAGNTARTCAILDAFINQVKAQSGKSITDPGTVDTLIADATRIRAVLGC